MKARTKGILNRLGIDNNGEDIQLDADDTEGDPRAAVRAVSKQARRKALAEQIESYDQGDATDA